MIAKTRKLAGLLAVVCACGCAAQPELRSVNRAQLESMIRQRVLERGFESHRVTRF